MAAPSIQIHVDGAPGQAVRVSIDPHATVQQLGVLCLEQLSLQAVPWAIVPFGTDGPPLSPSLPLDDPQIASVSDFSFWRLVTIQVTCPLADHPPKNLDVRVGTTILDILALYLEVPVGSPALDEWQLFAIRQGASPKVMDKLRRLNDDKLAGVLSFQARRNSSIAQMIEGPGKAKATIQILIGFQDHPPMAFQHGPETTVNDVLCQFLGVPSGTASTKDYEIFGVNSVGSRSTVNRKLKLSELAAKGFTAFSVRQNLSVRIFVEKVEGTAQNLPMGFGITVAQVIGHLVGKRQLGRAEDFVLCPVRNGSVGPPLPPDQRLTDETPLLLRRIGQLMHILRFLSRDGWEELARIAPDLKAFAIPGRDDYLVVPPGFGDPQFPVHVEKVGSALQTIEFTPPTSTSTRLFVAGWPDEYFAVNGALFDAISPGIMSTFSDAVTVLETSNLNDLRCIELILANLGLFEGALSLTHAWEDVPVVRITNLPPGFDSSCFQRTFSAGLPYMPLLYAKRAGLCCFRTGGDAWGAIDRLTFGKVGGREIEMLHWIDPASEEEAAKWKLVVGQFKREVPTAQVWVEMSRYGTVLAVRAIGDDGRYEIQFVDRAAAEKAQKSIPAEYPGLRVSQSK
jgi:hypothetical protein